MHLICALRRLLATGNYQHPIIRQMIKPPVDPHYQPPPKVSLKTDNVTTSELAKNEPIGDPHVTKKVQSNDIADIEKVLKHLKLRCRLNYCASRGGPCYVKQRVYLAWFVLHFLLIITISCRDIVWLVAHKLTILPSPFRAAAEKVEPIAAGALGDKLSASNPFRRALLTYLHIAGIDRGYGYFAPNVPCRI